MDKLWHWFEQLVHPFPFREVESPPGNILSFIFYYTRGLWKFLVLIGVLNSILAAGEALFFVCMGLIVDWTASSQPDEFYAAYGQKLLLMLLLSGVILPVATVFHSMLLHQTISSNYPMRIRWQMHRYMLKQSLSFFTDEFAGRVSNKVMQTAMAVRTAVLKLIDVMVHMIVYLLTMLYMLADADFILCIPLAVWLFVYTVAVFYFIPRLRKAAQIQADSRSDMVGRVVDSYVNISTVKLFGGKGREVRYARDSMEKYIKTEYKSLRLLTMFDVSVQLMNYSLLIVLSIMAVMLWINGFVTPGCIALAIGIAIRIVNMSRWMMWEVGAIFENIGIVYDGMRTLSKPIAVKDPDTPKVLGTCEGNISFSHVSFYYVKDRPVFSDLCFDIKAGQKVGIVGPSGAGKTTLINLLLRFYDVNDGCITLDGHDIRDITQDELHDNFAMVSQDPSLMHRTVGENITYGCNNNDIDAMTEAARMTDSLGFIESLSDYRGGRGFETLVGERGVKLSGGQRQRIALARVIMRNSPILILDEATSALDSESERIVQENLEKVMKNRTVIAIAHRLSTLCAMDRILVIDQGKIVENGTHEELIEKNGLYAKLWQRQVGGFIATQL